MTKSIFGVNELFGSWHCQLQQKWCEMEKNGHNQMIFALYMTAMTINWRMFFFCFVCEKMTSKILIILSDLQQLKLALGDVLIFKNLILHFKQIKAQRDIIKTQAKTKNIQMLISFN